MGGHPNDNPGQRDLHHKVTTLTLTSTSASAVAACVPAHVVATVATFPSCSRRPYRVNFPVSIDAEDVVDVIEFDPSLEAGRVDIDVVRWAHCTGLWRKSDMPPPGKNAWKNDPNRDWLSVLSHATMGYPTPRPRIESCGCIARRNARELAEQLGHFDYSGE